MNNNWTIASFKSVDFGITSIQGSEAQIVEKGLPQFFNLPTNYATIFYKFKKSPQHQSFRRGSCIKIKGRR
jgi:hypothetical protein